ncbi:hypothetical protein EYF80_025374 [Liparis tanakae]|uniref:Uncharacterized protein n=1 Tax=Liparis tanakae TaxID=230148 RepID=A0A4Z2HHP3_9TELE|nr:hypothetical protein EYF80_025374 [Liparis tanakae]
MEVVAHAAFAAVTQSSIVTPVTQNTDLLTSASVFTTRLRYADGGAAGTGAGMLVVRTFSRPNIAIVRPAEHAQ